MKFSVITINYNNIEGLRHTIESVVGQTYDDYEYIIIDGGGSTDGSVDVVKEYSSTDKSIIYPSPSRELFMYNLYTSITRQSSFIRKDLLLKYPYGENYKISSDWNFYL